MKNYLIAIIIFLFAASPAAFSQIEVKINPTGLIVGNNDISVEYLLSDELGVEARIPFGSRNRTLLDEDFDSFRTGVIFSGKYYFSPEYGGDKFYAGGYAKYINTSYNSTITNSQNSFKRNRVTLGVLMGFKWISDRNIVFDINAGLGRTISNNFSEAAIANGYANALEAITTFFRIDLVGSISVGYRFGLGSRKE